MTLGEIRRWFESHCHSPVLEFSIWSDDCAKVGTFVIHLKGIIHHGEIKLCKVFVAFATTNNIFNQRQWIYFTLKVFVQFTKITDPSNTSILLGYHKCR